MTPREGGVRNSLSVLPVKKHKGNDDRKIAEYLRYSHLGIQFLLAIGIPIALGIWLDRKLETKALFTILGLVLGFTAGTYSLHGQLFKRGGTKKRKRNPPGDAPGGS